MLSNGGFGVRNIKPEDREDFLRMSREFYNSPAVLHNIPDEFHTRAFQELMEQSPYARCFMLMCGEELAGYALLSLTYSREAGGNVVWVEELYISPKFRGKGGAHYFFGWLESCFPAARYRLETEHDNLRAKKLYCSLGYKPLEYEQLIKGR